MFDKETADGIFDDFMDGRFQQGALFADFVTILNMKAAHNVDNPEKMELLTGEWSNAQKGMLNLILIF